MTSQELRAALEANDMKGVVLQHKRSKRQYHVDHDVLAYCDQPKPYIYGTAHTPLLRHGRADRIQWFHLGNMELAQG